MDVMDALHQITGETINLSQQTGVYVKIVQGLVGVKLLSIAVREGILMPINASHTGMVSLASQPDKEISRIIRKLQNESPTDTRKMSVKEALAEVRLIREERISMRCDAYINGIGAVCFPVRPRDGGRAYVIGVVGPSHRIMDAHAEIVEAAETALNANNVELSYPD